MLYPQTNPHRQFLDLSGFWDFAFDADNQGYATGLPNGLLVSRPIAVPASWNDQFEEGRDYLGPAWYQTHFARPWGWESCRVFLRFGSVNYLAEAWLNGERLGEHEGGHLPFEFDITGLLRPDGNRLIVRVDGQLAFDRVPPGNVTGAPEDFFGSHAGNFPQAQFDFFPFCGIHRPVWLYAVPQAHIQDVTVSTELDGTTGLVQIRIQTSGPGAPAARFRFEGHGTNLQVETAAGEATLTIPNAALWSPAAPNLYNLTVELLENSAVVDSYHLPVGIRTVRVIGDQLLLNGQPIYLTGFGRHEDFPVVGRGYLPALITKDYAMLRWIGANSFRTSHYPYSEPMLDMADRLGFLVIAETPAVGLYFREDGLERRNALCELSLRDLIARDKNHPSVILWSLANEPHSKPPHAKPFFRGLYDTAKTLDPTRPVTVVSFIGADEEAFEFCDVVSLNRYLGWYSQPGDLDTALRLLSAELDEIHRRYPRPMILTEFGADAVAGHHAQPPEMFSEEYQAEMLARYIRLLRQKPFVVGEHPWAMCDFKTSQGITRVGALNHKGVFTRDRRPKLAAHKLRELWKTGD